MNASRYISVLDDHLQSNFDTMPPFGTERKWHSSDPINMGSCKTRVKVGELSGNSCPCFKHQFYTCFTPVACKVVQFRTILFSHFFLLNF